MTEAQNEIRVVHAPSLYTVPRDVAYAFKSLIPALLPPLVAPARNEGRHQKIEMPMEHYGSLSIGTIQGQIEVVGYAIDNNMVIFLNVIATTISAREAYKATLDLGTDMTLIKTGRSWGNTLYIPRNNDGKIKWSYKHHDFNLPILKARQTVSLLRSMGDSTRSDLGRYVMETSEADAQWALLGIVTEMTGLFIRPEWAQRLWHIAKAGGWVKKCDAHPIPFWRVEQSADIWRTVIQLGIAQDIFAFPSA